MEVRAHPISPPPPSRRVVEDVFPVHHIVEMVLEDEDPIDLPVAASHFVEVNKCTEKACCILFFLNVLLVATVIVLALSLQECQFKKTPPPCHGHQTV